ncbi:MAG: 1-acyl-sn-glycerol-3-phosphate acyltransferase [Prevotellaceae bacterium]|nr:1-acyl-sn-glycerol-3-phosphate acyltransferase [Prevotellaceae bacterium]
MGKKKAAWDRSDDTTTKTVKLPNGRKGLLYRAFKQYVRIAHSVYYRKIYFLDRENMPDNVPLMVVSDHQNSLNDALALVLAINYRSKRKIRAIARADAFNFPVFGTIFRGIGIMPAFRMMYEGIASLSNNAETFAKTTHELLNNGTVIIYPEAGHQDKRWLGKFSYGYLRFAFEAAEQSNFEKEIFVLPTCNHYSNYFGIQEDILIKFGKPVSIQPFYELYKIKPRTAQREANKVVRDSVDKLILNITDLENYPAIDFLRNTYGIKYAKDNGFDPDKLPEKLLADKQFFATLDALKTAESAENPPEDNKVQQVYDDAAFLNKEIKELKIRDEYFDKKPSLPEILFSALIFLLLFPVFLFAVISDILVIYPPKLINRRIKDEMLHGTISLVLSVLVTIPLLNIIAFFSVWAITGKIWITLLFLVCLPFLYIFAAYYGKYWRNWKGQIRFYKLINSEKLEKLAAVRKRIHETLDNLLK